MKKGPGPFNSLEGMRGRVEELGASGAVGFADDVDPGRADRAISSPTRFGPFDLPHRLAAHPMEGWDGDAATGEPTPDVLRRWDRLGASGAALLWGVEAFAVEFPYRANPHQLVLTRKTAGAVAAGVKRIRAAASGLVVVGAQLTCSGRWSRGGPFLMHHHPQLDGRVPGGAGVPLMADSLVEDLAGLYARAARAAREAGFDFVDLKACHGYWLNEALAARTRPGKYGGSFANRVKPLLLVVDAVRREVGPNFPLGVRLSMYDGLPHEEDASFAGDAGARVPGLKGIGRPVPYQVPYLWGFGTKEDDPNVPDPSEPLETIGLLLARGVTMFNLTCGCPYANPHLSRPTDTPPVDAYRPPRDPLLEVAIHFTLTAAAKRVHPGAAILGTGYSYLRGCKFLAAEHNLRSGFADLAGVGRALLAYPDEIRRVLETGQAPPERGRVVCTGDSACTTGPRLGLKSGCVYDPYYADVIREINTRLEAMGLRRK
jgi:2,4-dienoyl-CoA reductase-like NADH-dependent reductase (Old Yellow Enzyme family)